MGQGKGTQLQYIIFTISKDNSQIVIEREGEIDPKSEGRDAFEAFVKLLPKDECRYAVYDFDFELEEGGKRRKLMFVSW